MTPEEAGKLLTLASAFDGRTVDRAVSMVWAEALAHIDFLDAADAMKAHYQAETVWMMPAHVTRGVRRLREARERHARINRPRLERAPVTIPDDFDAMTAWFREHPGATVDDYQTQARRTP